MSLQSPLAAFDALIGAIHTALPAAQTALVQDFVAAYPVSPLQAPSEERAIIYYYGPARDVQIRGDMTLSETLPLEQLGSTNFWFFAGRYEPTARLDYRLVLDGEEQPDPRNDQQAPSGFGPKSCFAMFTYVAPREIVPRLGIATGTLTVCEGWQSRLYPSTRTLTIYTPAGYDPAQRYPSVFLQDGSDYLSYGNAATILDNLIADGTLPPLIAVFIDPSTEHGRLVDYDLNEAYVRCVCDEIVPWIATRYALDPDPARRIIGGASAGGLIALLIGFRRPDVFGQLLIQSSFASRTSDRVTKLYADNPRLALRLHIIIGTYETQIGSQLALPGAERDFVRGNRLLHDVLTSKGYPLVYAEFPEGHAWGLWRAQFGPALRFLLS